LASSIRTVLAPVVRGLLSPKFTEIIDPKSDSENS